jgi:hypothetical protein
LIPQALSGQLPEAREEEDIDLRGRARRRHRRREPSIDSAFKNVFMGIAFLFVSMALGFSRMGAGWWFWMLIPAFSMLGTGMAQYVRLKENKNQSSPIRSDRRPSLQTPREVDAFPTRATGELIAPPPSVTEGTTRHLGAEAPTRHFDDEVSS